MKTDPPDEGQSYSEADQQLKGITAYFEFAQTDKPGARKKPLHMIGTWELGTLLQMAECCAAEGRRFNIGYGNADLFIDLGKSDSGAPNILKIPRGTTLIALAAATLPASVLAKCKPPGQVPQQFIEFQMRLSALARSQPPTPMQDSAERVQKTINHLRSHTTSPTTHRRTIDIMLTGHSAEPDTGATKTPVRKIDSLAAFMQKPVSKPAAAQAPDPAAAQDAAAGSRLTGKP